jgi:multidrug transporter EmrE-like cation transporter
MSFVDVGLMSAAEIIGDFGFKDVARIGSLQGWAQGLLGYVGVIYFLIRSLRVGNVLYTNAAWDGISAILESLAAFFIMGERLTNAWQYAGIVFIVIGLFSLKMGKIPYD